METSRAWLGHATAGLGGKNPGGQSRATGHRPQATGAHSPLRELLTFQGHRRGRGRGGHAWHHAAPRLSSPAAPHFLPALGLQRRASGWPRLPGRLANQSRGVPPGNRAAQAEVSLGCPAVPKEPFHFPSNFRRLSWPQNTSMHPSPNRCLPCPGLCAPQAGRGGTGVRQH